MITYVTEFAVQAMKADHKNVLAYKDEKIRKLQSLLDAAKRAMQIHAGDICSANNETDMFVSKNKDLEEENTQLRGEKPTPFAWWKDCPGVAQKVMERIIERNDRLLERHDRLVERIKELELSVEDLGGSL